MPVLNGSKAVKSLIILHRNYNMAKREYIEANKDWLEAKAKEEGVKALPKGI